MSNSRSILLLITALVSLAAPRLSADQASDRAQASQCVAVLKSDAPRKAKADACRELARIGGPDAVPALAELLTDEKLAHMARYALETIPDPSVRCRPAPRAGPPPRQPEGRRHRQYRGAP